MQLTHQKVKEEKNTNTATGAATTGITVGVEKSTTKQRRSTNSANAKYIGLFVCVCLLLAAITLSILAAFGYYEFKAPCVRVESVAVGNIDVDFLSLLSGKPKGSVTLDISLQINNTNPYSLAYAQNKKKPGSIEFSGLRIGTFDIPNGIAVSRKASKSVVQANLQADGEGLSVRTLSEFIAGAAITLSFAGEISATGWLNFAPAVVEFRCNATLKGIVGASAEVNCYVEYEVTAVGEKGSASLTQGGMDREEQETLCYV